MMINEIAKFTIDPANSETFEQGLRDYIAKFADTPGCNTITIEREIEDPRHYYLRAQWDSVDAHKAMAGTEAGRYWREHVMPLYAAPSQVVHSQAIVVR